VLCAYGDFFALFDGFAEFTTFFHLQDLIRQDFSAVHSLMRPGDIITQPDFEREATPSTVQEYVTYREATLEFINRRGHRMADWVEEHHPEVPVCR
jgi:hypothetical protein